MRKYGKMVVIYIYITMGTMVIYDVTNNKKYQLSSVQYPTCCSSFILAGQYRISMMIIPNILDSIVSYNHQPKGLLSIALVDHFKLSASFWDILPGFPGKKNENNQSGDYLYIILI